ncbi:uncharacterized protein LOC142164570 isoform X2 [Nicotiana tabacum]|uniref:Uncharacterized protein LOC142164570 isoform X2 n=1 Tax=Nicotiana tabacum TaxID=4097 RepID=A0AC58S0T7_TOBAC
MFSLLGKRWANKRFQDFSCTIFVRITLSFASLFILSLFVFLVVAKFPADHFWATSSLYKAGFPKQTALTIRESYALLEKAASHQLCATTSRDNYKNIPCFNYHYLAFPELELRVSVPKAGYVEDEIGSKVKIICVFYTLQEWSHDYLISGYIKV